MERPRLEVADVFRRYGAAYREKHGASMSTMQRRVMTAIEVCRTAALGGHLECCNQCGHERNAFNSCRNRHCPKCQCLARAQWIEDRQTELLDCPYFHVVFTVGCETSSLYAPVLWRTRNVVEFRGSNREHLPSSELPSKMDFKREVHRGLSDQDRTVRW